MTALLRGAARPFSGSALTALVSPATRLLGLGEPTHGVEAFLELRNELFRHLVARHGYRSITIESDCLAALVADAYVTGGSISLDDAVSRGFSHGFGAAAANRELLRWMRAHNDRCPPQQRLHFSAFDGPLEISGAAAPHVAVTALYDYLAAHLDLPCSRETLDALLGPDERWTDPAALLDPAASVGRSAEAGHLRVLTDDLRTLLSMHTPHLTAATCTDAWWRADLYGRTAAGLLRYHAALAGTTAARVDTVMGVRETMMAGNLAAVLDRQAGRGPTLAFAHNRHLQRDRSHLRLGGTPVQWWSAGAIIGARLGDRYAFAASTFGSRGTDVPPAGTLEGLLSTLPHDRAVIDPARLTAAMDREVAPRVPVDHTYFALDPATVGQADAIVFIDRI